MNFYRYVVIRGVFREFPQNGSLKFNMAACLDKSQKWNKSYILWWYRYLSSILFQILFSKVELKLKKINSEKCCFGWPSRGLAQILSDWLCTYWSHIWLGCWLEMIILCYHTAFIHHKCIHDILKCFINFFPKNVPSVTALCPVSYAGRYSFLSQK